MGRGVNFPFILSKEWPHLPPIVPVLKQDIRVYLSPDLGVTPIASLISLLLWFHPHGSNLHPQVLLDLLSRGFTLVCHLKVSPRVPWTVLGGRAQCELHPHKWIRTIGVLVRGYFACGFLMKGVRSTAFLFLYKHSPHVMHLPTACYSSKTLTRHRYGDAGH